MPRSRKLEPIDELFLTLIKLRLVKEDEELSMFFVISERTVGRIFHFWLNFLFYQLKELDLWIPHNIVNEYMPRDKEISKHISHHGWHRNKCRVPWGPS